MKIEKIILGVLGMMPLIETLNGAFQGNHISDMYRILLLVLILFSLMKDYFYAQFFEMLFLCLFFVFLVFGSYTFFHGQLQFLLSDLKTIFRILLAPLYYVFFNVSILKKLVTRQDLSRLLSCFSILYSVLVIVPCMFGVGFSTYDAQGESFFTALNEGVGAKGYFIEVNSLCAILMASLVFTGESFLQSLCKEKKYYMNNFENKIYFIGFWLNCISLILLGTKTGLAFSVVYFIVVVFRVAVSKSFSLNFRIKVLALIMGGLVIVRIFFYDVILGMIEGIWGRSTYFYDQFDGNIITFFTSSRSLFLKNTLDTIVNSEVGNYLILFGGGYTVNFDKFYFPVRRVVTEMDWWDFFFSYGIVGIVSYLSFFRKGLINYFQEENKPIKSVLLVLFVYSIFAGHVLFNSMTATYLAIVLAYMSASSYKTMESEKN